MTMAKAYDIPVLEIGLGDIKDSLRDGVNDFFARPTTAIFVIVIYPFIGLLLYRLTFDQAILPLLFPIVSGFALVGPLTAAALYEISRRREHDGTVVDGVTAFEALDARRLVPLLQVGVLLLVIYAVWIGTAQVIYDVTMGGYVPASLGELAERVVSTPQGWALMVAGIGTGFVFAFVVLAVGAISPPAIMDRGLGAADAVALSIRAFVTNPKPMLAWGFLVAAGLVIGTLPLFLGLLIVLPVFGHATWQLYRRLVPADAPTV
jgi:uncharacterized membrane protein